MSQVTKAMLREKVNIYKFTETNKGCKAHKDPSCLCDVVIPNGEPLEIKYGSNVMFGELALKVLGAETLTPSNMYHWAGYLLGSHNMFRNMHKNFGVDDNVRRCGGATSIRRSFGTTPWMMLPQDIRKKLYHAAVYEKMPWPQAKQMLAELELEPNDMRYVAKVYNTRRYAKRVAPLSPLEL